MATPREQALQLLGANLPTGLGSPAFLDLSDRDVLMLILAVLAGYTGEGGGSVNVPAVPVNDVSKRTPHFFNVSNDSGSFPATATSWSFISFTGTSQLNDVEVPNNVPLSGSGLNQPLTYVVSGTAFGFYETAA